MMVKLVEVRFVGFRGCFFFWTVFFFSEVSDSFFVDVGMISYVCRCYKIGKIRVYEGCRGWV